MAGIAQLVRAPGCGSGGRRFDPGCPPHLNKHYMQILAYTIFSFVTFFGLVSYIKIAKRFNIVDIPSSRRNHKGIIARGGGIIVISFTILAYFGYRFYFYHYIEVQQFGLLLLGLALSIVFFIEDIKPMPIIIRLGAQIIACILAIYLLKNNLANDFLVFIPFWLKAVAIFIGLLWYINLYNFMDGLDGITATQTSSICIYALIILTFAGNYNLYHRQQIAEQPIILDSEIVIEISDNNSALISGVDMSYKPNRLISYKPFIVMLLIATLIFLYFNKTPAKIFIGDSGSVGLGFILGILLIKIGCEYSILTAFSCTLYYIVDSTITVFCRWYNKEKIWTPHLKHFVQQANRSGLSAMNISALILVLNIALSAIGYLIMVNLSNKLMALGLFTIELVLTAFLLIYFYKRFKRI